MLGAEPSSNRGVMRCGLADARSSALALSLRSRGLGRKRKCASPGRAAEKLLRAARSRLRIRPER